MMPFIMAILPFDSTCQQGCVLAFSGGGGGVLVVCAATGAAVKRASAQAQNRFFIDRHPRQIVISYASIYCSPGNWYSLLCNEAPLWGCSKGINLHNPVIFQYYSKT